MLQAQVDDALRASKTVEFTPFHTFPSGLTSDVWSTRAPQDFELPVGLRFGDTAVPHGRVGVYEELPVSRKVGGSRTAFAEPLDVGANVPTVESADRWRSFCEDTQ